MSRDRRLRHSVLGIALLGLLLQAAPALTQISCDWWCRWVPCPDAPSTACIDPGGNVITCYDWGICFPVVDGFQVSRLGQPSFNVHGDVPAGGVTPVQAARCSLAFSPRQQFAQSGFSAR